MQEKYNQGIIIRKLNILYQKYFKNTVVKTRWNIII